MSSKSDSTIKTEEVNRSSNTKSNNNSNENNKLNDEENAKKEGNNNKINTNSSSDKTSSNFDFMSSFKEKTFSLERLNTYLQDNKPVSTFANPKISLNSDKKKCISK